MSMQSIGTAAARAVERWSWWQNALAGRVGPIHEGEPQQGYYRVRSKGGQWEPVAIWQDDDGAWLAYRAGREVRADEVWSFACRNPIRHADYEKAMAGGGFDDEPPAPSGHNSGSDDPFEALRLEFLGEKEQAEEFMKAEVTTQAQADRVAIWAKRLAEIAKRADQMRVVEKQPHLDACRAVDDMFRDLKEEPDLLAKRLKAHLKPFLQARIKAEEDRQRKAREEADAARRAADEAAAAARAAVADSDGAAERARADADRLAAQARAAEAEADARKVNAGRTGARVSMRSEKVGVVTDYAKAAAALVAMKHPDFMAAVDQFAQRAARAGMPFDGMEIKIEERVV